MNFNHNANKFYLLTNQPVIFTNSEEKENSFKMTIPTLKDFYTNEDLIFCINLLEQDVEEIQKMINIKIESHYEFIHLVNSFAAKNKEFKTLSDLIINGLKVIIPEITFNKILKIKDIIVTEKLFNQIIEVIYMSLDKEKIIINEDDDEFTKREKLMKIKIQKIKRNSNNGKGTNIEDMIAAILYEFPQYKIEDLMKLNLYTIYYLFKYVGKIANYEVSKIAAGNGLSKKYSYFIE